MLLLQVWSHAELSAETVASSGYVACSLGAWVIVGTAACVSSSLVNVTFARENVRCMCWQQVGSLEFSCLCDNDSDSFPGAFLEYSVLDDKATLWFFHYFRCYLLCDVAIKRHDMHFSPLGGRGTRCQMSRWSGHK